MALADGATSTVAIRPSPSDGLEPGREVPQGAWLVDDAVAGERSRPPGHLDADLDHVVDVALRVRAPRDGEAHEVERGGLLGAVGPQAEHHRADLAPAHAAGLVEGDSEGLPRVV